MSFKGKVILVTGASSGIGADVALHLAKLGGSVAAVDRNATRLNNVIQQIRASGAPEPLAIVADITTDSEKIINQTVKKFGRLDVLVNNAGIAISPPTPVFGSLEVYDQIFATNVRGVLALTQLAVPHLAKTKGNVVNVSSVAATNVIANGTAYAMSKAALDHFTRCAAVELGPKGIRVNSVNPGETDTPIFKALGYDEAAKKELFESYKKVYPIGRAGRVEDVSKAIAYLAQDNDFLTGVFLYVDGASHYKTRGFVSS